MELKLYLNYKCESIFKPYESFDMDMVSKDRDKNKVHLITSH